MVKEAIDQGSPWLWGSFWKSHHSALENWWFCISKQHPAWLTAVSQDLPILMAAEAPGRSFTGIHCGHDLSRTPKEQTLPFLWIFTFTYGGSSQLGAILLPLGDIFGCVTSQEGRRYWCLLEERPGMLLNTLCTKRGLPPQQRMTTSTGQRLRNPGRGRSTFKMLKCISSITSSQSANNPWNSWLTAWGLMDDWQPKIQTWELIYSQSHCRAFHFWDLPRWLNIFPNFISTSSKLSFNKDTKWSWLQLIWCKLQFHRLSL